ncbi:Protein CBG25943 [Caenorhabditis briggsae]|uniref:Protein CBG25943 n=1 Tax=Caenorhabditis briggsae TaxID=6238 RepID=B6IK75_CAEBR|nr:Protein CBG25943 [Caenorhabditis briggsae]CAS00305.1 Protein CBG25943 [Caenorhabditis briggsae]
MILLLFYPFYLYLPPCFLYFPRIFSLRFLDPETVFLGEKKNSHVKFIIIINKLTNLFTDIF